MNQSEYLNLSKKIYQYALNLCKNETIAEDLTQQTFLKLLTHTKKIESNTAWMKEVLKNDFIKFMKLEKVEIKEENLDHISDVKAENIDFPTIDDKQAKTILTKTEYDFYKKMLKTSTLKELSKKYNIPYRTAIDLHERIKRNFRSYILLQEGFTAGNEILSYNDYTKVKRFIEKYKKEKGNLDSFKNLTSEIDEKKNYEFEKIISWKVSLLSHRNFKLYTVASGENSEIFMINFIFYINKANHIKIKSIEKNLPLMKFKIPENVTVLDKLPKSKGVVIGNKEEVIARIKEIVKT